MPTKRNNLKAQDEIVVIQIRRVLNSALHSYLVSGELGYNTDTKQMYVGDASANLEVVLANKYLKRKVLDKNYTDNGRYNMQKSQDVKKSQGVKKCYFSTFIDETTMTCSPNGRFDDYGFPIKLCDKLPSCNIIKELNKNNKSRNKNGIKKIQAFL